MPEKGRLDVIINRCVDFWQPQSIVKNSLQLFLIRQFLTLDGIDKFQQLPEVWREPIMIKNCGFWLLGFVC
jgi:hypothetical protein